MPDIYVVADCKRGCGMTCICGTGRLIRQSAAFRDSIPFKLASSQPKTKKELAEDAALEKEKAALDKAIRHLSGPRGIGGGKVTLTERERVSLERYIGEPVRDAQDARMKMKRKGLRFAEPGEESEELFEAHIDYARADGEKRGEALPEKYGFQGWDRYGVMPSPKPFDFEGRLRYHQERLGERNE
jgi:hypothetical protein